MAEEEGTTREEQLQIAQHFLRNSPPGQFAAVLQDVQVLCNPNPLEDDFVAECAKDFNGRTNRVLRDGSNPPIILSELALTESGQVMHPRTQQLFTVDHVNMKVVGEPSSMSDPMDSELEDVRSQVETALEAYVAAQYQEGTAAAAVYAINGELRVVISGERLNLRNFWSGLFVSTWTVKPKTLAVSGEIKVRAHYFEDGNVQLQTKKKIDESIASGDDIGVAVKTLIADEEKKLQGGLELMYANMTEETFKAMRRVMPVHRNKMNWNINEVNSRMQLGKKA